MAEDRPGNCHSCLDHIQIRLQQQLTLHRTAFKKYSKTLLMQHATDFCAGLSFLAHVTPILFHFHWLPIQFQSKVLGITHKALNDTGLECLDCLLS